MKRPIEPVSIVSHHEYVVDGSGRGCCRWCDREVQFPPDGKGEVKVVKEGWLHLPKSPDVQPSDNTQVQQPAPGPVPVLPSLGTGEPPKPKRKIMKMTKILKNRLLEVGPKQFCDEWGYLSRGMGRFVQMYRKLGGVWPKPDDESVLKDYVKKTKKEYEQSVKPTVSISTKGGNHIKLVIELTIGGEE